MDRLHTPDSRPLPLSSLGVLTLALATLLPLTPGCDGARGSALVPSVGAPRVDPWPDAAAGVTDRDLARLVEETWEAWLRAHPFQASRLGDPRYHGAIPIQNDVERQRRSDELGTFLARLGQIDAGRLGFEDQLTLGMLAEELENERALLGLGLEQWQVDPLFGPHVQLLDLTKSQPVGTPREREQLLERWGQLDSYLRRIGDDLRRGAASGKVASSTAILKSVRQLEGILDTSPLESPLVQLATGGGKWVDLPAFGSVSEIARRELGDARKQSLLRRANPHLQDGERLVTGTRVLIPAEDDPLMPEERGAFLYDVLRAVEEQVYPGLASYHNLLASELLPLAREDARPGIVALEGGAAAYPLLIRSTTRLPLAECDPAAIHAFGLEEVARIRAEIADLGERLFGTRVVEEIQERLRSDPAMFFTSRDEVEDKARAALTRAAAAAPAYFGRLPLAPCEVVRLPAYEERNSTTAYYNEPDPTGGRPGRYYVNTFAPETRPRFEAEVLAYHEAVPGHHLQLAIQQELEDLPRFRRHLGCESFVEGWALYTERLSEEMGLYSEDLDRMGVLSYDAWRASRLVVDTGLHAQGWSRDRAIQYLFENTLLSRENVENEVDRYIAWPSQALAYKIGQREFLALRDQQRTELGAAFSYPDFHDLVLGQGALSLGALRRVVQRASSPLETSAVDTTESSLTGDAPDFEGVLDGGESAPLDAGSGVEPVPPSPVPAGGGQR